MEPVLPRSTGANSCCHRLAGALPPESTVLGIRGWRQVTPLPIPYTGSAVGVARLVKIEVLTTSVCHGMRRAPTGYARASSILMAGVPPFWSEIGTTSPWTARRKEGR